MTKTEYLAELKRRLRHLTEVDREDALVYYEEYLDEVEMEGVDIIERLGPPREVAAKVLAESAVREDVKTERPKSSGIKMTWAVILAIFAAPIALPIAISLGATAFALLVSLVAVVVAFGVTGVALGIGGIAYAIGSIFTVGQSFPSALMLLGGGLIMFGLFILFFKATVEISRKSFNALSKWIGETILRRAK